jgi:uncharacterized Rmd1/YagE family protein
MTAYCTAERYKMEELFLVRRPCFQLYPAVSLLLSLPFSVQFAARSDGIVSRREVST